MASGGGGKWLKKQASNNIMMFRILAGTRDS